SLAGGLDAGGAGQRQPELEVCQGPGLLGEVEIEARSLQREPVQPLRLGAEQADDAAALGGPGGLFEGGPGFGGRSQVSPPRRIVSAAFTLSRLLESFTAVSVPSGGAPMSCEAVAAAALLWLAAGPAAPLPVTPAAAVAQDPLFDGIVERARALKLEVDGYRASGRSEERRVGKECRSGWAPDQ